MATRAELKTRKVQDECELFNQNYPLGTSVRYWKGEKFGPPSGWGATRSEAQPLSGHTAVVWIEGCVGCVALSHVEPV